MITRQQIDQLVEFRDGEHLVTSCYLNLDRAKMPPQILKIRTKDLLQSAQRELAAKAAAHGQRESLRRDFEHIEEYAMQEIALGRHRALAIFSCAGLRFWQPFGLPRMVRNILIADHDPYIRPLMAILTEYHRYCVVLVDRAIGRVFEVYMGEIIERSEKVDHLLRKVREGGFGGRDERRIERHRDQVVHQHFENLAGSVFEIFKRNRFDGLILGGHRNVLSEFKNHLHPYLHERLVDMFHAEPGKISVADVLKNTLAIERRLELERERKHAEQLVRQARAGDLAVTGVSATIEALARGESQVLMVEDGFETPGYACYQCHRLSLEYRNCPQCGNPMEPCPDIVDEAIAMAMEKNCQVEHVHGPTPLRDAGHMGALLRYHAQTLQANA